ncbi:MAG: STAS domain-containing protein [Deltaproteobacteria bacterium]|nr:STAS domain-containing protein [Deltaproteobacteria bacterium]
MEVPILKERDYLIATVQAALTDAEFVKLREELAARTRRFHSKGVILDVSALDVVDSFSARTLRSIAHVCRALGAETVIVGMHPEVAQTMVQLGLTLGDVKTAVDLEDGLELLRASGKGGRREWRATRAYPSRRKPTS